MARARPGVVFSRRQFLNTEEHGGSAHIEAYVKEADGTSIDAEFSVMDCNRKATLDFEVYSANAEELAHLRQKALKFRRAVMQFTDALLSQLTDMEKSL